MNFYRKDAGSLKMIYINFHTPTSPREFSVSILYTDKMYDCILKSYYQIINCNFFYIFFMKSDI